MCVSKVKAIQIGGYLKMKTRPIVSIIMLMHNITPWLKQSSKWTLKSIKEHTIYPACEIIVVDSCSTAFRWEKLNQEMVKDGAIVIRFEKNIGMTGGFNAGLAMATGDFIFLVENDVVVTDFWVTNALKCFAENPKCALIKAEEDDSLRNPHKKECDYNQDERYKEIQDSNPAWLKKTLSVKPKDLDHPSFGSDAWTSLWCFAIRRSALQDIGGYLFDEKVGLNWNEDQDLIWRIRDANLKSFILPSMYVYHRAAQTCSLKGDYAKSFEKRLGAKYFREKHDVVLTDKGWPARRKYREALLKNEGIICHEYGELGELDEYGRKIG